MKRTKFIKEELVCGYGISDIDGSSNTIAYKKWRGMLERCYSESFLERQPTYVGTNVCKAWLRFSNFQKWYDSNQTMGFHETLDLDKDLKVLGCRLYSPETCIFVPRSINILYDSKGNLRCSKEKALEVIQYNKYVYGTGEDLFYEELGSLLCMLEDRLK